MDSTHFDVSMRLIRCEMTNLVVLSLKRGEMDEVSSKEGPPDAFAVIARDTLDDSQERPKPAIHPHKFLEP